MYRRGFNLTGSCSEGQKIGGWLEPRVILDSRHYRNVYYKGFLKQYLVEAKLRQKSPMKKGIVSFYPEHSWIDLWSSVINYLPTIISVFIRQEVPRWPWKCCLFQQVRPGAQYIKVSQVLWTMAQYIQENAVSQYFRRGVNLPEVRNVQCVTF